VAARSLPENLTLIIADAPPLYGIRQRAQQLASGLASAVGSVGGSLLYIDEPGNIVTVFLSPEKPLSNLWKWTSGPVREPGSVISHFVPPAGIPFGYHFNAINQWNHFWYRLTLGNRWRKGDGPVVLVVCNVLGLGWVGRLGEDVAIYDCADEITEFRQARMRRHAVVAMEKELLGKVDAVVTTSQSLYDSKSPYAKHARLIRNAADIEHFRNASEITQKPDDIAHLQKPIVGFYGYLADWLDWPLIDHVVREGTEFDWVFIGPTTRNLSDLKELPNFHALGKKPYAVLPEYLAHFACAHIPFDRTPLTVHVNPVKLYEYLAAGVPVVATGLPELKQYADVISITDDPGEYLNAVRQATREDSPELHKARTERVANETWDSRVEDYTELILQLLRAI
jgi:glycosyltransferase involved in cell wall biosynthesis